MSIAVTADVVHNIDDLNEATECALISTAFYLCVVRLLVYSLHQKDMLYVVKTMKEDWILSSREDRTILAKKTMFAFRLAKYFISTVAMTIVLFMCIPFLEVCVWIQLENFSLKMSELNDRILKLENVSLKLLMDKLYAYENSYFYEYN